MRRRAELKPTCSAALLLVASPALAGQYVFTDIVLPSGYQGEAMALNDKDQVIGSAIPNQSGGRFTPSFTWSGGQALVLDLPSLPVLSDINKHGLCVGTRQSDGSGVTYNITTHKITRLRSVYRDTPSPAKINADAVVLALANNRTGHHRGVLIKDHGAIIVHYPGSFDTTPSAVNSVGDVAGTFLAAPQSKTSAFIYHNGSYTELPVPNGNVLFHVAALDSQDTVAGSYRDESNVKHGFMVVNGVFQTIDYPGAGTTSTEVSGIGAQGELVGSYSQGPTSYGFVYAGGTFTSISHPGSTFTQLVGINSNATVAGTYADQAGKPHAFIAVCPATQSPCT